MDKKFWIGFILVFIVLSILEFLLNTVFLADDFAATAHLWRPEAEMKIWLFYVVYIFISFFFTLIFTKGYEGNGVAEGLRYGLYVGLLMAIPMAYGMYASMPIPYGLALKWFLCGTVEYMLLGVLLALVFGKQALVKKA